MGFLESRRDGYEAQFASGNMRNFCKRARAFHYAGLWAAAQLGKAGQAADDYAGEVVRRLALASGDKRAMGKLVRDLGGQVDEAGICAKLDELMLSPA